MKVKNGCQKSFFHLFVLMISSVIRWSSLATQFNNSVFYSYCFRNIVVLYGVHI